MKKSCLVSVLVASFAHAALAAAPLLGEYLTVSLSGEPEIREYASLAELPGGVQDARYKTDTLLLKRVRAPESEEAARIGDPAAPSDSLERLRPAAITEPFYLGVFEITQKQWALIREEWPSYFTNAAFRETRPVQNVSYEDFRGKAASGIDWPATGDAVDLYSFLGRLRLRTEGQIRFDLPTADQWEYACLAGQPPVTESEALKKIARYAQNGGMIDNGTSAMAEPPRDSDLAHGTATVGSLAPNAWGFYDMQGNVMEWCRDWFSTTPPRRELRGGGYWNFLYGGASYSSPFTRRFSSLVGAGNAYISAGGRVMAPAWRFKPSGGGALCFSPAQTAARARLLENVKNVDSVGIPGPVLVCSSNAFPLAIGARDGDTQPIAAAAFFGKGRIVALGHPGFLDAASIDLADTAVFLKNTAAWLGEDADAAAPIATPSAGIARALKAAGIAVTKVSSLAEAKQSRVLAVNPDDLAPAEIEPLREWIHNGGALLCSGLGWGWKQIRTRATGKAALSSDNLFNRLLAPAGLLLGDGGLDRTTGSTGYSVTLPIPEGVNGVTAAQKGTSDAQALKTLFKLADALPPGAQPGLDAAFAALAEEIPPALSGPGRLSVLFHKNAWQNAPFKPWPAHPFAKIYPGVASGSDRTDGIRAAIDLAIPRWHSTGAFANAGEPVTVTLSEGAENLGLRLRIGTTQDDNSFKASDWNRAPLVTLEVPLTNSTTTLSTPFGGLIYVVVPRRMSEKPEVSVLIDGAVKAPWFKLGRDTDEDWVARIRDFPAPQAELSSSNFILTVQSSVIRELANPAALMAFWDAVLDCDARLAGAPFPRLSPERACSDVELSSGYLHNGYPVMCHCDSTEQGLASLAALQSRGDGWGIFHELGHNHQNASWTFDGTGEVTCNFFALYPIEKLNGFKPRDTRVGNADLLGRETALKRRKAWAGKGKSFESWKSDPFLALDFFVCLQEVYGWEALEKFFSEYVSGSPTYRPPMPANDSEKRDQWATRLSRLVGENVAAVFDAWNIPISDAARAACEKYPRPQDARLFEGLE